MRRVTFCAVWCALVSSPVLAQGTPNAQGPQCTAGRLVGTWERTSLMVDGKEAQPPLAAQVVVLGEDGWFSQTQLPHGRKSVGKPLEQYTVDDYVKSYSGVSASRGTYTVENNVLARKHVDDVDPNLVGHDEVGEFHLEGDTMTLRGSTPSRGKFEARFRRLKPQAVVAQQPNMEREREHGARAVTWSASLSHLRSLRIWRASAGKQASVNREG